jgi:hypothetical protein
MSTVEKNAEGSLRFTDPVSRYTTVYAQAKITEDRYECTLSGTQNYERNPFIFEAILNAKGNPTFKVSYPFVVTDDQVVVISVNTMEASEIGEIYELPIYIAGELISYNQPLMGRNLIMDSFTVEGFSLDESYWFQLRVDCTTGDNVSLVGELLLLEKDGKLDYLFEGILRYNYR